MHDVPETGRTTSLLPTETHSRSRPRQSQPMHPDRQLKDVIQTFTLRLRLRHVVPPDISVTPSAHSTTSPPKRPKHSHPMPPDQNRISIRVLPHRPLQPRRQILLKRRILNNRHHQRIMKSESPLLPFTSGNSLDLLDVADLEAGVRAVQFLD
jgi:hypothetical protein